MAITTGLQIVVIFQDAAGQPIPDPAYIYTPVRYHLFESEAHTFTLHVLTHDQTRQIPLSAESSQQLLALLDRFPAENLSAPTRSFDGMLYDLVLLRAQGSMICHWQNQDWRRAPDQPVEIWEHIQAFVDLVGELGKS